MAIQIGTKAPDVTMFMQGADGIKQVKVSDYAGKRNVVLLFFPAAFTGTCTKEMCMVRDSMSDYDSLNAEVIGVSPDYPAALAVWGKHNNLNMTLASDFNRDAVNAYDIVFPGWGGSMVGVPIRSAFVIDKEGIIRYSHLCPTPGDVPPFNEIQDVLKTL
jgi:glutaredoxin-dependent peroxiredoxin